MNLGSSNLMLLIHVAEHFIMLICPYCFYRFRSPVDIVFSDDTSNLLTESVIVP